MRSKAHSLKCGSDNKNKLKCASKNQSQNIEFEEYYNCLYGGTNQNECDNQNNKSNNHELYLQKVSESTLSPLDEKRCYLIGIKSILWN